MDIDQDYVRREARAIEAEHQDALKADRVMLDRLVNGDGAQLDAGTKAAIITGGLNRRKVLMFGGVAVVTSAVFAACKGATPAVSITPATTTTTALHGNESDIAILRTASSIEALAMAVYGTAIVTQLVKTSATLNLLKVFQMQHSQHLDLFQRTTRSAGGTAYGDPNPVLLQQVIQPRVAALTSEADVVDLAYDLEHLAAATYQADIGMFSAPAFNTTLASVGATEARHVALLAVLGGKSATGTPDGAFQLDQDEVKPGTGV